MADIHAYMIHLKTFFLIPFCVVCSSVVLQRSMLPILSILSLLAIVPMLPILHV